ncbi:glycoside hydrolase family 19 protein [Paenibacillus sp. TAF43_2]
MTPQAPKPSAHDVIVNKWKPSKEDIAKGLKQPGLALPSWCLVRSVLLISSSLTFK